LHELRLILIIPKKGALVLNETGPLN